MALFPGLSWLQLVLGHRSLDQLQDAFPDCIVRTGEARALLNTLFPRTPSDIWALLWQRGFELCSPRLPLARLAAVRVS